jgi:hypothetical protein
MTVSMNDILKKKMKMLTEFLDKEKENGSFYE